MVLIRIQRIRQRSMRDLIRTQICILISESALVTGFLSMEVIMQGIRLTESGTHSCAIIKLNSNFNYRG